MLLTGGCSVFDPMREVAAELQKLKRNQDLTGDPEGVRLQAERVVRAYNELRAEAKSANFKSDDFPVGKLGELFHQVRHLDGWLEPAPAEEEGADPGANDGARIAKALPSEKGVNEAFAERVGQRIDEALLFIERARRLTDVCSAAIKALEVENSGDIAFTMGSELFSAIDDARKALEGAA